MRTRRRGDRRNREENISPFKKFIYNLSHDRRYGLVALGIVVMLAAGGVAIAVANSSKDVSAPKSSQTPSSVASSQPSAQPSAQTSQSPTPAVSATPVPKPTLDPEDAKEYEEYFDLIEKGLMDKDTLAGLLGEGGDFTAEPSPSQGENTKNLTTIGIIIGKDNDSISSGFGKQAEKYVKDEIIDKYVIYKAAGDKNQQIQDVRSLINQGCSTIVVSGVDKRTYQLICSISDKADVSIIAINAPVDEGYVVNVRNGEYNGGELFADFIKKNGVRGNVVLVSDSATSTYSSKTYKQLNDGFTDSGFVCKTGVFSDQPNYTKNLEDAISKKPSAIVVRYGQGVGAVKAAARLGSIPQIIATDASAGMIKTWHSLKNEGLLFTKSDPDGTLVETRVKAPGSLIAAYLWPDSEALGRAACTFATNFAQGKKLSGKAPIDYPVPYGGLVTNANLDEYYKIAKDMKDTDCLSVATTDTSDVDSYFVK